jgi:exo-beta-1,3-glucanase (GH17 family)/cellulose synthase/poly-beta-1,6-N-acetylglucosamine synthase-like glycosyltransferase
VIAKLAQILRSRSGAVRIALALLLVVSASALFWASRDYTVMAPEWDGLVRGVTYYPSHTYDSEQLKHVPPERIDADMEQLSHFTSHIRTYTVNYGLDKVPEIARRYGLTVSVGIWIGADLDKNEIEIEKALAAILANRRVVDRVIVGNEALMRGDVTDDQLIGYIKRVRHALPARIKVTTAETWSTWLMHDTVGQYCDVIFVHLLPYWEGADIRGSMGFLQGAFNHVADEFPDKPIVIGEVGWPSQGWTRGSAEASLANEAYFVRNFVQLALDKGYDYYIIEAYDQPWKAAIEGKGGGVGAYWGLFNVEGRPKFNFTGDVRSFPEWRRYTLLAAAFSLLLGLVILGRMPRVRSTGYVVMGGLVALVTTGILLLIDAVTLNYIEPANIAMILAMSPLVLLASIVILTEGVELASALWRVEKRLVRATIPENPPMVSVHVPCYNEPPEMLIETLNALAKLDYENFEVIVLDNNTPDEETWKPVEAHCETLGPRFRFFHFGGVKGFKAGALNIAINVTNPEAKYIAVIDSDYHVDPNWMRLTLPYFADERIAIVQGPQDYRDAPESLFKAMCYEEYRGFFQIGMVERNESDAIIQHGTMTIVRKDKLIEVGGWATWCITEDTELGLRLFEAGYGAAYLPVSMGKGLIPDTLKSFQGQRYRWVYGAMQIMKRHARAIFGGSTKLSWAQRYHFFSGWLPWLSDGLGMIVTFIALIWSFAMWAAPRYVDVPMPVLSAAALALFAAKMLKTLLLYPSKVRSGMRGALMASVAGLALTHVVAKAVWSGIFTSGVGFFRTPKCADEAMLSQALRGVWQETTLFGFCILAIISVMETGRYDDPAAWLWIIMLVVQSLPYAATVVTAAVSARGLAKDHTTPAIPAEPPKSLLKI